MKVAILITDGGDGSASLSWFKDLELAQTVADTDDWCETFGMNEGSPTIIEVQDDFVPPGGFHDKHYNAEGEEE